MSCHLSLVQLEPALAGADVADLCRQPDELPGGPHIQAGHRGVLHPAWDRASHGKHPFHKLQCRCFSLIHLSALKENQMLLSSPLGWAFILLIRVHTRSLIVVALLVVVLHSDLALGLLVVEGHAVGTSLRQPLHLQLPVNHALLVHLHLQRTI